MSDIEKAEINGRNSEKFDIEKFTEDLIQLQLKHNCLLEGYDISIWTAKKGIESAKQFNKSDFLVTEEKIRETWNNRITEYD